jgi:diadenosine tetraphosphatase ApaH/serine/threonine PP2A family protein phosphatase
MKIRPEHLKDIESMPQALRSLVEAELAAGNEIVEIGHSFPAAPVGCYVKLARPVSTRPRASSEEIHFIDRNTSIYSGEFADSKRYFFVLEPPNPPPPEPDMNAIREAANLPRLQPEFPSGSAPDRFRQSMAIDYAKWHDGIGYDLDIIRNATPQELAEIEQLLLDRPVSDWRDVEALAAIDSPRARAVLLQTLRHPDHQVRTAVAEYASHLVSDDERTASLVAALEHAELYEGLSQALDQVESFHPPRIIDALFRGLLKRKGENAVHFAAMLMFIHGKASTSFDWDQRPFFLQFHTEDREDRRRHFRELCQRIDVNPDEMLRRYDR